MKNTCVQILMSPSRSFQRSKLARSSEKLYVQGDNKRIDRVNKAKNCMCKEIINAMLAFTSMYVFRKRFIIFFLEGGVQ